MAKIKIIFIIILLSFIEFKICLCETLTIDQKITIFGELIKDNEPEFYIYLIHKTMEIYQILIVSNDELDIEFYVWLLKQKYYLK